ncbi:hypothetical protein DTO027B5_2086 [Paecilomyces variotii]|nr:hypothetical protein DTO169C6_625 [Paecilomyces variotii]KAJ9258237.1 hypothetical protein DTO195F2_5279 [Paecilomyces variotii]KAJ9290796.1 hypothetical protein DTO021C3_1730 [Paecilomyces variotii]KAJ9325713.1 hypothetical protein DTO027B3_3357 [Paecilomyces variotii]KAJ9336083.1 hypothetical protein DTO027B5_2086 [Paecilomyces variotii]
MPSSATGTALRERTADSHESRPMQQELFCCVLAGLLTGSSRQLRTGKNTISLLIEKDILSPSHPFMSTGVGPARISLPSFRSDQDHLANPRSRHEGTSAAASKEKW